MSRIFAFILGTSFVLAVMEVRTEIVLACLGVGLVGLIGTKFLATRQYSRAFYRMVAEYAHSVGLTYNRQERQWEDNRFAFLMVGAFVIFGVGIALTIWSANPIFILIGSILILMIVVVTALGQRSDQNEAWQKLAIENNLTHESTGSGNGNVRVHGMYRGREVLLELYLTREFYFSKSKYGSRIRSIPITNTRIIATADIPPDTHLFIRGSKHKSRPPELVSHLLERTTLKERLAAVSTAKIELHDQQLWFVQRGAVNNASSFSFC